MILLDTNVISEPWRPKPDPAVLAWMDAQAVETLYLSAITVAELRFGLAALPAGKKRALLQERLEHTLLPLFRDRILPFDLDASLAYDELMARARAAGRGLSASDGYIAATAASRKLIVASRDTHAFDAAGVPYRNPWQYLG